MYLIIEDGDLFKSEELTDGMIKDCEKGIIMIVDMDTHMEYDVNYKWISIKDDLD